MKPYLLIIAIFSLSCLWLRWFITRGPSKGDWEIRVGKGLLMWQGPRNHWIPGIVWWPGLDKAGNTRDMRRLVRFSRWFWFWNAPRMLRTKRETMSQCEERRIKRAILFKIGRTMK